jgi:hypothetical protein
VKGVVLGLVVVGLVLSCAVPPRPTNGLMETRIEKMNEVTQLWTQIRGWRTELNMELDPSNSTLIEFRNKSVDDAKKICPENQQVPKRCDDTCRLSEAICDNADQICKIADELGKHDRAQDKCTSAKASCREAKKKCCGCIQKPPPPPDDPATPAKP